MIPEFPLPPHDADFYKSQLCQLPPLFGHFVNVPVLTESTTFFEKLPSINEIGIKNAVKSAAIYHNMKAQSTSQQKLKSSSTMTNSLRGVASACAVLSSKTFTIL